MDTSQSDARRALRELLQEFESVLASEYDALLRRDTAQLEVAVSDKQRLTAALGETARLCDLQTRGNHPDVAVQREWHDIEGLLARCALANQTNGAAVNSSKNLVGSLLDVLSGRSPRARLYDAKGRTGDNGLSSRARERV